MSNLVPWLIKRRERFYQGGELERVISSFLEMVDKGAKVKEYTDAIIVLEDFGLPGNARAWLLFDKFTRGVVRAIKDVSDTFDGKNLYASTHDPRIRNILLKVGFVQYKQDSFDYWLVKRGEQYGM